MSTQQHDERLHPREQSGKFASKPTADAAGGMDTLSAAPAGLPAVAPAAPPRPASKMPDGGLTATLGASRLQFAKDGYESGRGVNEDGVAYATFDAVRTAGERRHQIASITVYDDAESTILVTPRPFESTTANMAAQDRLVKAIASSNYRVWNVSPWPYRGLKTQQG